MTLEDAVRDNIRWMQAGGDNDPPWRDGEEGAGYRIGIHYASNPFEVPEWVRTGEMRWQQLPQGFWMGTVYRGQTSARVCVKYAILEKRANRQDRSIAWLCAGQAHNADARNVLRQDQSLTMRVLDEFGGIV